jgi:hypothetical protein
MPVIRVFNYYAPLNLRRPYLRRLIQLCKDANRLGVAYWDGEWKLRFVKIIN